MSKVMYRFDDRYISCRAGVYDDIRPRSIRREAALCLQTPKLALVLSFDFGD